MEELGVEKNVMVMDRPVKSLYGMIARQTVTEIEVRLRGEGQAVWSNMKSIRAILHVTGPCLLQFIVANGNKTQK